MMKKLLIIVAVLLVTILISNRESFAQPEVKAEFDVDVSAFVDIDSFSTIEVEPGSNEVGLQSDVVARILDRNGTPVSGHSVHLYIEEADGTVLFVQPGLSNADGYARGKVRALSEGAFVIRAYDSTFDENIVLSDSDTFYVFPVPVPQLETEPYYTKGNSNKLFWEEIDGLSTYEYYLQVSTSSDFEEIMASSGWVSSFAYQFNDLEGGEIYFYRVKARNSALSESGWSNTQFSVQDDQSPVIKINKVSVQKSSGDISGIEIELDVTDDLSLGSVTLYCKLQNGDLNECGTLENIGNEFTANIPISDLERGPLFSLLDEYIFCFIAEDEAGNSSQNCDAKVSTESSIETPIPIISNIVNRIIDGFTKFVRYMDGLTSDLLGRTEAWILEIISLLLLLLAMIFSVAVLTGSFLLVPSYITSWLYNASKFIGVKPHGRPTGFIYDVVTKNPVKWAYVQIYDANNRLVWRDFSNPTGEFMTDLPIGKYRVTVSSPGYLFPSELVKPREDRKLGKIYQGEYIMTTKKTPLSIAIPMDPVNMRVSIEGSFWKAKKIELLKSLNVLVVVLGLGLALYLVGRGPNIFNIVILLLYIPSVFLYLKSIFKLKLGVA